ncbi:MAG: cation diffusion facilitator family transporter [Chloroflexi bacterium]|nr:cation diffusion facilitator family transporter [Chloroflexota bacterium]MCI0579385.1 cation diffusion facilitator family transporter [Chloroflexota bacterium]MCI0643789.1 cation diffusion facilitator family transporter [Chloroflexota bacterium]MCI0730023.1 cation diffusion facilitator family transporter [Chloroflexota bacterium]
MARPDHHPHNHNQTGRDHRHSPGQWLRSILCLPDHAHHYQELVSDQAFLNNAAGIRTVWLALGALLLTAVIQIAIVSWSGSVALFADTMHNIGDGLNSIPLLITFYLARRAATRRYTYGFGKAEDIAGIFIVLSIAFSAGVIFWQSYQKLLNPQPLSNLGWLVAAAIVGFLGNEAVALMQIRVGKKINSAALVADGLHARTDGLTSLAILAAAAGSWLGYPILDPIVGFLIGLTILFIAKDAMKTMWYRLMDAIEPEILDEAETIVQRQSGVKALRRLRLRWLGHQLQAEVTIAVDPQLTVVEGHHVAEEVRHALFHHIAGLSEAIVHVDPWSIVDPWSTVDQGPTWADSYHELTVHYEKVPQPIGLPT